MFLFRLFGLLLLGIVALPFLLSGLFLLRRSFKVPRNGMTPPSEPGVEATDMVRCPACGAFHLAGTICSCGRDVNSPPPRL
jgi:hypothetical protein